ncbi:F0F1 ATP synthase subunit I [Proteus vulgaris]|uniref:F0F1 ATP synthase subunit I n=1 Tax=Proteus vulgaris TaxID=585 RepID=A0A6G6SN76_PROVU|nr:F0F1 ATP synthase subunit I [Proteus vulgaris]MBI6528248.1 F0F1 ATP synthase subunit I [Proteus vulgaris]QIF95983.1 F0F1 ATP synthase subunit I [Proteus vulgaris]QPN90632.1 F0F1 ATP synthase subunit I [Proteus vulgaris]SUC24947.1 F0F1 ATP synthase subunit I [Proteus vulgaris]
MSVSLYNGKVALKLLFLQFMTFVILSAGFYLKSTDWSFSAFLGGMACWLPNIAFLLLMRLQKVNEEEAPVRINWLFAFSEGLKVILSIALLIVALGVFKAAFAPLVMTYLAVLVMQVVAPAVING